MLRWLKWWWLNQAAIVRGFVWRWPSRPPTPPGYSSVSCGLRSSRESWQLYAYGWIPWCVQRARVPGTQQDLGVARVFLVRLPEDEG